MARMDKLSGYATTITTSADGKDWCVVYHRTCIVQFNDSTITLRTGGWDSVTTRRKMNQAPQTSSGLAIPSIATRAKALSNSRV